MMRHNGTLLESITNYYKYMEDNHEFKHTLESIIDAFNNDIDIINGTSDTLSSCIIWWDKI